MKVLITGGSGFVGKAVRKVLSRKKIKTTVLTRHEVPIYKNETLLSGIDLLNLTLQDFRELVIPYDCIIHLAWNVNPKNYKDSLDNIAHLQSSILLSQAISGLRNKCLIGAGTCLEYDLSQGVLYPDSMELPNTLYGCSKLALKNTAKQFFENSCNKFIWARLFHLYGDGEYSERLYPSILTAVRNKKLFVVKNGGLIRDYIHVDIAAEILVSNIYTETNFKIINVSSGVGQTIKQFALSFVAEENRKFLKFADKIQNSSEAPIIIGAHKK